MMLPHLFTLFWSRPLQWLHCSSSVDEKDKVSGLTKGSTFVFQCNNCTASEILEDWTSFHWLMRLAEIQMRMQICRKTSLFYHLLPWPCICGRVRRQYVWQHRGSSRKGHLVDRPGSTRPQGVHCHWCNQQLQKYYRTVSPSLLINNPSGACV